MGQISSCDVWLEGVEGAAVAVQGNCSLGRSTSNDIVLNDKKASRRHAIIHRQGHDEYWLVDFGSTNGTVVNDRRVFRPTLLNDRDRILIGDECLTFRKQTPASAPAKRATTRVTVREIKTIAAWLLVADVEGSTRLVLESPPDALPQLLGVWFGRSKEIIDSSGGHINKFLGDGFFAYWPDQEPAAGRVKTAIQKLSQLQPGRPAFRWVLHYGLVSAGGEGALAEENLLGSEVYFVFRMEELAGRLNLSRLLSDAAQQKLCMPGAAPAGSHLLKGFQGKRTFHTF
jgi:pSer/pThr/pTyr-binding forkhead associated (FHA) protein